LKTLDKNVVCKNYFGPVEKLLMKQSPNSTYFSCPENVGKRNKSAQSNLGRGPRRSAVAHVRRKVLVTMGEKLSNLY